MTIFQQMIQCCDHVRGMIRLGENPFSPFFLQLASGAFQKLHYALVVKGRIGTVKEFAVCYNMIEKFIPVTTVSNIASAFSGNVDFLAGFFIFLNQGNESSLFGCCYGSHHPGGSRSDNNYFFHSVSARSSSDVSFLIKE